MDRDRLWHTVYTHLQTYLIIICFSVCCVIKTYFVMSDFLLFLIWNKEKYSAFLWVISNIWNYLPILFLMKKNRWGIATNCLFLLLSNDIFYLWQGKNWKKASIRRKRINGKKMSGKKSSSMNQFLYMSAQNKKKIIFKAPSFLKTLQKKLPSLM